MEWFEHLVKQFDFNQTKAIEPKKAEVVETKASKSVYSYMANAGGNQWWMEVFKRGDVGFEKNPDRFTVRAASVKGNHVAWFSNPTTNEQQGGYNTIDEALADLQDSTRRGFPPEG